MLNHFGSGELEYVPFPEVLKGKYQSFTEADDTNLLAAGYDGGFTPIEEAAEEYCQLLDKTGGYYVYEAKAVFFDRDGVLNVDVAISTKLRTCAGLTVHARLWRI